MKFRSASLAFLGLVLPAVAAAQTESQMHPVTPNPPAHHTTAREQMQLARQQRQAAGAQRKALGASIRDHLRAERNERLDREAGVAAQAENDRARVEDEARQVRVQVQTRRTGGFHASDPGLDWRGLATTSGQLNAVEIAEQDPCLSFEGHGGALYPVTEYLTDRRTNNDVARVRATFFAKPYFFRDGVRYDRTTVFVGVQRCYQFVRH